MSDEFPGEEAERKGKGSRRLLAVLRFLLILFGVGLVLAAVWKGRWYGILAWLITVVVLLDTSVNVFYSMYENPGSRRLGLLFWIAAFLLGMPATRRVTAEGKAVTTRPAGPLGNLFARFGVPGQLIVDGGMAAVLERRGAFTRVVGPGRYSLQRFEQVVHVIDLRPQVRRIELKDVRTADGLAFDVRLEARFRIASDEESPGSKPGAAQGAQGDSGASAEKSPPKDGEASQPAYPFSKDAIRRLVYEGGILFDKEAGKQEDWRDGVVRVIEQAARDLSASWPLQKFLVLTSSPRDSTGEKSTNQERGRKRFQEELTEEARVRLEKMGVSLLGIDVGPLRLAPEVQQLLSMPVKRALDVGWARTLEQAIQRVAEGLQMALNTIGQATRQVPAEAQSHVLVSLMAQLERMSQDLLQVSAPYREPRELPEKRREELTKEPPQ